MAVARQGPVQDIRGTAARFGGPFAQVVSFNPEANRMIEQT
jgi:hypothetical protein